MMMMMMTMMMMTMMMMMIEKRLSHECMSAKLSRRGPTPSTMRDEEYTVKKIHAIVQCKLTHYLEE